MIKHIVLFKPKDVENQAKVMEELNTKLKGLLPVISDIKDYNWGANASEEDRSKGFKYGFIMTFDSLDALKRYLIHPAHLEVVTFIKANVADILVFDLPVK